MKWSPTRALHSPAGQIWSSEITIDMLCVSLRSQAVSGVHPRVYIDYCMPAVDTEDSKLQCAPYKSLLAQVA